MLSLAAVACGLLSCRKDLEEATPQPAAAAVLSPAAQLATAGWHQTGLLVSTATADQVAEADLFSHVSPRLLDKLAAFQADGTYTVLKGGADASPRAGRWLLSPAGDSLTLTLAKHVRHLAVRELTGSTMSLTYTDAAAGGSVTTYTSVYGH